MNEWKSNGDIPTHKQILEALAQYQKQGAISGNVGEMADMLIEESDRGVVVILGSLIEDILLEELTKKFIPLDKSEQKNLSRAGGLLSTFDHRIRLAHALGMIDSDLVETLQIIKAMRNACAHSRREITFQTDELRYALSLLFDDDTALYMRENRAGSATMIHRYMFIVAFVIISAVLKGDTLDVASNKGQRLMDAALQFAQKEVAKRAASLEKRKKQRETRPRSTPMG